MDFQLWYTAAILILLTVFLIKEWIEIEIVLFSAVMLLIIGNVISIKDAFAGFSNEGMLTIAMMFIVAGALNNAGILRQINPVIFGKGNDSPRLKLFRILIPTSAVSAFMNNTPVVAMLIPALRTWAEKYHLAPSKFLIPISYAAILGGMCTLIGTSTNLIVHGLMIDHGMKGIGFFEISKIGVPLAIIGVLFLVILGPRLLPERKEPMVELGENTREFVIELKVMPNYENIGKTIEDAGMRHLTGLFLFQIERDSRIIAPAHPDEIILPGDRLFFTGIPKTILEFKKTPGLALTEDAHFDIKQYDASQVKTFEGVISANSPLIGKTVRDSNFRGRYESVIIAIHRQGERIKRKVGDIVLRPGDTVLLLAEKNFRRKWYHSRDFFLIAGAESVPSKPYWQRVISVAVFSIMILLAVFEVLPLLSAAGLAVIVLLLTKVIRPPEIPQFIDWRVLIVIALSLGVAAAVEKSGLAEFLANSLVNFGISFGIFGILTTIYILTSIYTTIITNNAAAALIFPVVYSITAKLGADPKAFAMTIMIAAAASFATPISYQTNLMVYGPGGYKFKDFLKIGVPLQCFTGACALILIYVYYL